GEDEELPLVRQVLAAHAYWRLKSLEVDLVILSDRPTSYFEELWHQLQESVRGSESPTLVDKPGGVFLRQTAHLAPEDLVLLHAAGGVVLAGNRGTLAVQVDRLEPAATLPGPLTVARGKKARKDPAGSTPVGLPADLSFFNGRGGFTPDG